MVKGSSKLKGGASEPVVAAASPDAQTPQQRIAELEEQLDNTRQSLTQVSNQLNDALIDLSVMRDRYTEEINSGNKIRSDNLRLQQKLAQMEQPST